MTTLISPPSAVFPAPVVAAGIPIGAAWAATARLPMRAVVVAVTRILRAHTV